MVNWLGSYLPLISLELVTTVEYRDIVEGRKKIRRMVVIDKFSKRTFGEYDVIVCASVCYDLGTSGFAFIFISFCFSFQS